MDTNPFPDLKINDASILDSITTKVDCPLCNTKRKYFCYSCIAYVNGVEKLMPTIKLPVKVDIIKHKQELDSKSTAVHAALLADEHCKIYSFPDIPEYDPVTDVVVFPSDDCITVEEWSEKLTCQQGETTSVDALSDEKAAVKTVVFIDCTWNQIHPIINSPKLAGLQRIGMHTYTTKFWRPNGSKRDNTCLATIEAIYYFLKEYHTIILKQEYSGEYDNLLIIFKYMYKKIREYHNGGSNLKAYKRKLPPD